MSATHAKTTLITFAMAAGLLIASDAVAGCGCDHPPPVRDWVYPNIAWPEAPVDVWAPEASSPDTCVRFGGHGGKRVGSRAGPRPGETGYCAAGLKPQVLTFEYTGLDCKASAHAQGDKAKCHGDPEGASLVSIRAAQKHGKGNVWFSGEVALGETFSLDAKNAERLRFAGGEAEIEITDLAGDELQTVKLRVSCDRPLNPGDQFGSLKLVGFTPEPSKHDDVVAEMPDLSLGPQAVEVFDVPCDEVKGHSVPLRAVDESGFTAMSRPFPMIEEQGTIRYKGFYAAVAADGTLLIPFDMSRVLRPMQFFLIMKNLPLRFSEEDVTYYNKDQYNLKLFENLVASPEDYEWGAYYGTTIDESSKPEKNSDVIGYWRHDFSAYHEAHLPGGTHEVATDGLHPDGSNHIDHEYLILAIKGWKIDPKYPEDESKWERLEPGKVKLNIEVLQLFTDAPVGLRTLETDYKRVLHDSKWEIKVDKKYHTLEAVEKKSPKHPFDELIEADADDEEPAAP